MINAFKLRIYFLILIFSCLDKYEAYAYFVDTIQAEKINLAIRKTVDVLLKEAGDSISRIPAVEQVNDCKWRVQLSDSFNYKMLSVHLAESFKTYNINAPYYVAIKRCGTGLLDLGYHKSDVTSEGENVPCQDRQISATCHYLEVTFTEVTKVNLAWIPTSAMTFLVFGIGFYVLLYKKKKANTLNEKSEEDFNKREPDWIKFGHSQLDFEGLSLLIRDQKQTLTYREAKLLNLFVSHPGKLLTREFILQQVWENEGILVGRSLDVFVSRLRKKLINDEQITIVGVHGVGYKLEINN